MISVDEEDRENVEISVGVLKMDTERELAKYFVVKDSPSLLQINPHEIRMKIIFKRRLTSETMKAFFPSLLLIAAATQRLSSACPTSSILRLQPT